MNPDYYLGQAELATELKGFIENLKFDVKLQEDTIMDVLGAYLDNKEKLTKELYIEYAPDTVKAKLLSEVA